MNMKLNLILLATLLALTNAKKGGVRRRLPGNGNGNGNGNNNSDDETKVAVCHVPPGNPNNPQDIEIGESAVSSHVGNHELDCLGTCAECYTPPADEETTDPCDSDPCQNGGTCTVSASGTFTCTCASGFTGDSCETDVDDCASSPCLNGGTCTDGVDSFTCTCADGFSGDTCDTADPVETRAEEPVEEDKTAEEDTTPVADDAPGDGAAPGGRGDPHFVKWGGGKFDFHGACDLVLLDAPDFDNGKGLTVQIRTEIKSWWSYISHAAIKIGDDVLEVQSGFDKDHKARYWVNGEAGEPIITQKMLPFNLGGHNVRYRDLTEKSYQFKIFLGENQYIVIKTVKNWIRIEMDQIHSTEDFSTSRGMMGSFPEGNLIARDGATRMEQDLNSFGQEWQVTNEEPMLFSKVVAPQVPQKCRMPEVQSMEQRRLLSGVSQEEAEELCKHADDIKDCVFDVVSTGDPDIVEEYL